LNLHDGRRLDAVDNRPAAVAHFEKAHHIFSQLGADPYVQVCANEFGRSPSHRRVREPFGPSRLSRAELAVARLVSTGLNEPRGGHPPSCR